MFDDLWGQCNMFTYAQCRKESPCKGNISLHVPQAKPRRADAKIPKILGLKGEATREHERVGDERSQVASTLLCPGEEGTFGRLKQEEKQRSLRSILLCFAPDSHLPLSSVPFCLFFSQCYFKITFRMDTGCQWKPFPWLSIRVPFPGTFKMSQHKADTESPLVSKEWIMKAPMFRMSDQQT